MIAQRTTERRSERARPGLAGRALLVFAAGVALAIPIARAEAASVAALEQRIAAARGEAESLSGEIEARLVELASARQQAAAAAAREAELSAVLERGRERAARLAERVEVAEVRLERTRERLQRAFDALAARLVAIYKSQGPDATAVLLDAAGYDDLTTRAELLRRIESADRALVARVRALKRDVADRAARLREARAAVERHNAEVAAARDRIAGARAAAEARAARVAEARAARAATLERLQARIGEWSSRVERLERIAPAEAAAQAGNWSGDYAIPEAIVICESGGNYSALNPSSGAGGAYQILPSTWHLYGGKGLPHEASPAEQDAIAAQIWADSGPAAWACAR